jgi:hypothetical protein
LILNPTLKNNWKKRLLKRFEEFKDKDCIEPSEYIEGLGIDFEKDFPPDDDKKRKFVKHPQEANIGALMSMPLLGIKSHSALARHLRDNPEFAERLGYNFDDDGDTMTPDKRSFRHFIKNILNEEHRELIRFIGKEIVKLAEKYGISFGDDVIDVQEIEVETPDALDGQVLEKKRKVNRMAKKILVKCLKFAKVGRNMHHPMEAYLKLLTDMAHRKEFAENRYLSNKDDVESGLTDLQLPTSDSLLRHIKKWEENPKGMRKMFMDSFEMVLGRTKKIKNLIKDGHVNLAIDPTQNWYFGDKNDKMVVTRSQKKPKGTKWCHEYVTMSIVNKNVKYIVMALPKGKDENKLEIVRDLLVFAMRKFKIRYIVMDREFSNEPYIMLLKSLGLKFVFIAKRQKNVNRLIKQAYTLPYSRKDFKIFDEHDLKVNAIVMKGRKKDKNGNDTHVVFITNANFEISKSDQNIIATKFDNIYRSRWRIEDAFKQVKKYLPKTTSKSHTIRYFYFLFACLIYNLWILARCIINLIRFCKRKSDLRLTESDFIKKILNLLCT